MEYNSENKVSIETVYYFEPSGLGSQAYRSIYTYNDDNTFTIKSYSGDHNSQTNLSDIETLYTYNGKNISEITDNNGYKISYTYDDKNNAFQNIHAIEVLNLLSENEFGATIYGNTNNMISYVESGLGYDYTDTMEYTYI